MERTQQHGESTNAVRLINVMAESEGRVNYRTASLYLTILV